jgi:hypothetical protein
MILIRYSCRMYQDQVKISLYVRKMLSICMLVVSIFIHLFILLLFYFVYLDLTIRLFDSGRNFFVWYSFFVNFCTFSCDRRRYLSICGSTVLVD